SGARSRSAPSSESAHRQMTSAAAAEATPASARAIAHRIGPNDFDDVTTSAPLWTPLSGEAPLRGLPRDRQEAGDRGAVAVVALDLDRPVVLLDDPVAHRETQPHPRFLRREERIEDPRAQSGRDAAALVRDDR